MIIDVHTHLTSVKSYEDANLGHYIKSISDVARFASKEPKLFDTRFSEEPIDISDILIRDMDSHNIGMAVCNIATGRASNDFHAASVKKHPDRLIGLARLPRESNGAETAKELTRAIKDLGMAGIGETVLARFAPTPPYEIHKNQELTDIMEVASRLRVPILFHTGLNHAGGARNSQAYADPIYVDGIAGRYPEVPIVLGHMGGEFIRFFEGALLVAMRNDNVYLDTSKSRPEFVGQAVRTIGAERIMFGSDWSSIFRHVSDPLDYYNLMIKIVKEAPITQQEKEAILFDNAARLFRVKPH